MGKRGDLNKTLTGFYDTMLSTLGPQGWWPGRTRFEVIVGAILTQNTSWSNVEKAVTNLKARGLLRPAEMHRAGAAQLSAHIRPAGYFNIKARRLKNFLDFLFGRYGGSVGRLMRAPDLRGELLSVNGIGPETADSIALYAGRRPEFVVDAYTKRILSRHGLTPEKASYEEVKALFMESLPPDEALFNEYHALLVEVGKSFCRPRGGLCGPCPLGRFLIPTKGGISRHNRRYGKDKSTRPGSCG